jgi:hypothetical protein
VGAYSFLVDRRLSRLSELELTPSPPEQRVRRVLPGIAADGYAWLRHAEDMVTNGRWRLQHTAFDNAPHGREVHWHSGLAWWLIALGRLRAAFMGGRLVDSVERMAVFANPMLLVCVLLCLPMIVALRFGWRVGVLLALGMLGSHQYLEGFLPGYPDHHGLISLTALCSIVFLVLAGGGWIRPGASVGCRVLFPAGERQARLWAILAALCGAAGLWINAVSQVLVLAGVGIGIVSGALAFSQRAQEQGLRYCPEMWAVWGRVGGAASLLFYILEYVPGHVGMQLAANHPFHALAWVGAGEALAVLSGHLATRRPLGRRRQVRLGLGLGLAAILPVLVLFGRSEWWPPGDPFLLAVHANITEFRPLIARVRQGTLEVWGWVGILPLFALAGVRVVFWRHVPAGARAVLLLALGPTLILTALTFYQTRWGIHCGSMFLGVMTVVTALLFDDTAHRRGWVRHAGTGVFLVAAAAFIAVPVRDLAQARGLAYEKRLGVTVQEARELLIRDVALLIQRQAQGRPVIVLSSPTVTLRTAYFSGGQGIATLYWENVAGLQAAAEICSTPDDEVALRLCRARGITHIVFVSSRSGITPYVEEFHELWQTMGGKGDLGQGMAFKTFYQREPPNWLRRIDYPRNILTGLLHADVLIYQVVPEA